jgi:ribokinase
MSGRVIVVGSVNVDLVATVERLPAAGETVTGATFARHPGGKGANQATAAARLGARVAFVGAVGDDSLADEARDALTAEGIDIAQLAVLPGPTGVALILVDAAGENLIAVASGANGALTPALVMAAIERLVPGPGDVVVAGCEIPTVVAQAVLQASRARGARTVLNPAPATGLGWDFLAETDVLVPNRVELGQLAGSSESDDEQTAAISLLASDRPGVREAVVVTLGASGALLVRRSVPAVVVPALPVEAVDTVGAGDALIGALAADLAAGQDLDASVRRGVAAASLATTRRGARAGMPTRAEVDQAVRGQ